MTEQEYVLCADLRTIRLVLSNLREVIPENNPHVPREEYQTVMRLISEWQDRLFAVGLITHPPSDDPR